MGGSKFTTTLSTLRNAPESLFTAMFSGRHELRTDGQGCYFIDRDGRHFHDILNFLRDGHFNYPADGTDFKYLMELRAEADFYGLAGLVAAIDKYPYALTRVQRAVSLNTEDSWMYEDGQDEVRVRGPGMRSLPRMTPGEGGAGLGMRWLHTAGAHAQRCSPCSRVCTSCIVCHPRSYAALPLHGRRPCTSLWVRLPAQESRAVGGAHC